MVITLTRESVAEFQTRRRQVEAFSVALFAKARETLIWENENIGTQHKYLNYELDTDKSTCVEFYPDEDLVQFFVYDTWRYGGYDQQYITIPLSKLLDDSWRETAVKEYQAKLEQKRKEDESAKQEKELKAKERRRQEYEKLKQEFE